MPAISLHMYLTIDEQIFGGIPAVHYDETRVGSLEEGKQLGEGKLLPEDLRHVAKVNLDPDP